MTWPHERREAMVGDAARPEAVAKQHARGMRTARERIELLVDAGSFVEIGALARPVEADIPGDGVVTGTADIDARPAVVVASDFTAAGGSNGLVGNEKLRRCWEIAATRGIPVVMLFDGGGHRIQEGLDARDFAGGFDIQEMQTRLSGWVPMVAAILGPGYGQPTLAASICDYVVAVRGQASLGMAPPALVRAATGEEVDAALGSPDVQASYGTIDLAVDTEDEALDALRWYLAYLPPHAEAEPPIVTPESPFPEAAAALDGVVPADLRTAYDMDDVVAGLVDDGSEIAIKGAFAPHLITVLARIEGRTIGIVANQPLHQAGMLDAAAADKAAHLISLCDAFAIPVLVLMDLPGLAVGTAAEAGGLARSSGRLILEFGAATVPTMLVVVRKGYGGAYVVLGGGRSFHAEVVLAWPYAETAVMGVETAARLMRRPELEGRHRDLVAAIRGAEGFGFDAVVAPSRTRARLVAALRTLPRRRLMVTLTPRHHPVSPL